MAKAKKQLTAEQKNVLAERLKKARETKKAKKEAEEKKEQPETPPTPTPATPPDVPEENSTAAPVPLAEPSTTGGNPYIGGHSLDKEHIG